MRMADTHQERGWQVKITADVFLHLCGDRDTRAPSVRVTVITLWVIWVEIWGDIFLLLSLAINFFFWC
jgi:hypothetical protein